MTTRGVDDGNRPYEFAVCLTHDVDRVYKTYQSLYNAITERDPSRIAGLVAANNPYWQFERIMDIESSLGVRSSFHVLDEKRLLARPVREWVTRSGWKLFAGRYDVTDDAVAATLRVLDRFGWELALHGSYTSSTDPDRFTTEKARIERAADTTIRGNRQHYWRLSRPDTWRHLRDAGISYDASIGDSHALTFQEGYDLLRPFGNEFVVFPWSLMDGAVMRSADSPTGALGNCTAVLEEAREHGSVVCLDWHLARFCADDYPGWGRVYEAAIERALEMGAWVGPPGTFYDALPHPNGTIDDALSTLTSGDEPIDQGDSQPDLRELSHD